MSEPAYISITIMVPVDKGPEVALIAALEDVMNQLSKPNTIGGANASHKQRAADWLQSKYGTPR